MWVAHELVQRLWGCFVDLTFEMDDADWKIRVLDVTRMLPGARAER
jgi:hypothetical protein